MAEDYERNLLVVTNTRIRGGRAGDYHDWLENKLKPALEAAGITGVYFSHMTHGGSSICRMAVHVDELGRARPALPARSESLKSARRYLTVWVPWWPTATGEFCYIVPT